MKDKHKHFKDKKQRRPASEPLPDNSRKSFDFPNVNRVVIAGQLLQDPPLRWTSRGVPVTNFVIATQPEPEEPQPEGLQRTPCFISIVVWAQQAVQCNKYLKKGNSVLIIGELQSMPNSSPDKGFYPIQVNAQWIQYLEKGLVSAIDPSYEHQGDGILEMAENTKSGDF
jgi:single-strand DNA-binding protein